MRNESHRKLNYQLFTDEHDGVTRCVITCEIVFDDEGKSLTENFSREVSFKEFKEAIGGLSESSELSQIEKSKRCFVYEDREGYCHILFPKEQYKQEPKDLDVQGFHDSHLEEVSEFFVSERSKIPKETIFRDAWKKGDKNEPIKVDFNKCLEIHRMRLKKACEIKIEHLDLELERALEDDNLPLQVSCRKTKKILRNLHQMNLTHCKNTEDIKKSVPIELRDVWTFYKID